MRGRSQPDSWTRKNSAKQLEDEDEAGILERAEPESWTRKDSAKQLDNEGKTVPNNWIMKERLGEGGTRRTANNCKTKVASEARILSGRRRKTLPKV